jgi:tRNA 2-thiouridine synthesizing protein E
MPDISKFIGDESVYSECTEHLLDLEEWNEDMAVATATDEAIVMTAEHWDVVNFLREHYIENGPTSARSLNAILEERYAPKGGRKYLYTLFPNGPIGQGSRIGGLPVPDDATNPSFGYSL